jgi:hypothetical protein
VSWYYNRNLGTVVEFTGVTAWTLNGNIEFEKGLEKQFGLPRIWYGPFNTRDEAVAAQTAHPSALDEAKATAQKAIPDVAGAITQATNTAVKLGMRLAEAAVGIVLLAIAANAILKQTTGVDVAKTAAKAGKKAATVAAVA